MTRPSEGTRPMTTRDRRPAVHAPARAVAAAASVALLLAGCSLFSGGAAEAEPAPAPEPATAVPTGDEPVQDTWVYERVRTVLADGSLVDVTDRLLAGLTGDEDAALELIDGVRFTPIPDLAPSIRDTPDTFREDLDVVAGIVSTGGEQRLQVIATPTGDRSVDADDLLVLDLSHLGVAGGAPLIVDFAFGQGLPSAADEADLPSAELLGHRMRGGQFQWFGVTADGERTTGLQTVLGSVPTGAQAGATDARAESGTLRIEHALQRGPGPSHVTPVGFGDDDGIPLKAQPTLKPVDDLGGCKGSPIKCVSQYFKDMKKGFKESLDSLFDDNMPPSPRQPTPCTGPCGGGSGEPHLRTFDGVRYDLQLVGEFVLADSEQLTVQTRQEPYGDSTRVSIITAAAIEVGGHRVSARTHRDPVVRIDGEPVPMAQLTEGIDLGDHFAWAFAGDLFVAGPDDVQVSVRGLETGNFDVFVDAGTSETAWEGLLGSPDREAENDLTARGGQQLPLDPPVEALYGAFGESWRIGEGEALFDYEDGESTATFTDRSFPDAHLGYDDLTPAQRAVAETLCALAGITDPTAFRWCVFDYAVTRDVSFIRDARFAAVSYDAPGGGWLAQIEGASLADPALFDRAGHVLVPARTDDGGLVVALDLATGELAWQSATGAGLCLAVTAGGSIVAASHGEDGFAVSVLDPADGAEISSTPTVLAGCDSATAAGDTVLLRMKDDVFGFRADDAVIGFETEIAGLRTDPVVAEDGTVWMARYLDEASGAVRLDPVTGDIEHAELPVPRVLTHAAPTERGFVVGYEDEDGETGGLLRYSPATDDPHSGARPTPLPQTVDGMEFSRIPTGPLAGDGGLVAGYITSEQVGVFDASTGQPLQLIGPSSFNNNHDQLGMTGGAVIVGPFGGDAWVEAYDGASGRLLWSAPDPGENAEYADAGINDAKLFGPATASGQVVVLTTMNGGIVASLVGPGM
ncbi:PQQ-binding-like beta-propeller repeat protein [Pseudactinotalea sp. HY160]|nr:PQQ-binding-like beta-propeller repeat protein [Pseudactinotalea sp. HY160]